MTGGGAHPVPRPRRLRGFGQPCVLGRVLRRSHRVGTLGVGHDALETLLAGLPGDGRAGLQLAPAALLRTVLSFEDLRVEREPEKALDRMLEAAAVAVIGEAGSQPLDQADVLIDGPQRQNAATKRHLAPSMQARIPRQPCLSGSTLT